MKLHQSILEYRKGRYGWWALLLIVGAVVLFGSHGDFQPPNGGTWQGYVLGSVGLALIVWFCFRWNGGLLSLVYDVRL